MKQYGFKVSDSQMSHRAKGFQSVYDKLKNYLIDKDNADRTLNDAIKNVRDAVGTRTVLENKDYSKHPEIVAQMQAKNGKLFCVPLNFNHKRCLKILKHS